MPTKFNNFAIVNSFLYYCKLKEQPKHFFMDVVSTEKVQRQVQRLEVLTAEKYGCCLEEILSNKN